MIIANSCKTETYKNLYGLWQWDYGQVLRIQGLDLPTAVEIHFSLQEKGGEAVTRVGTTKDGVTDVAIPDSMLENNGSAVDYFIYAFIYLTDETSGQTEYKISMQVKARPKPEAFDSPEDAELFREAIAAVNAAADRAETAEKEAEGWVRNRDMRYFVKLDVRKCFESIDHNLLIEFLEKHIKNEKLIWLIKMLISSFERGLSISSYLSQYLCNLYMSILYHYIMEELYKTRRGKRTNLVRHCLIYMDDILLVGSQRRDMEMAVKRVVKKAEDMGLVIKPNYQVKPIDGNCIDMMGFKIYRTYTEIRGRIFLRVRRSFRRARKRITLRIAKKCISYYGYLKHTNSKRIIRRWKVKSTIKKCKGVIRNESKIFRTAITR